MAPVFDAETIKLELQCFGQRIGDSDRDNEVIDKFREVCLNHSLDELAVVSQWLAYSKNNGDLSLTPGNLKRFDLQLQQNLKPARGGSTKVTDRRDVSTHDDSISNELLSAYGTPALKAKRKATQSTPDNPTAKRPLVGSMKSPSATLSFSPGSFSPNMTTPSRTYGTRKSRGDVLMQIGQQGTEDWSGSEVTRKSLDVGPLQVRGLREPYKYMYEQPAEEAAVVDSLIDSAQKSLAERVLASLSEGVTKGASSTANATSSTTDNGGDSEDMTQTFQPVRALSQQNVAVVGQVVCDGQGKLNTESVVLQGSTELSRGECVPFKMADIAAYSLFPGQILAATGRNIDGTKFVANAVFTDDPIKPQPIDSLASGLSVVVASGPFTPADSLDNEPLKDLAAILMNSRPDLCILIGPFVDSKHPQLEELDITYEDFFEKIVTGLVPLTESCHVALVPSLRDAHHSPIFPQAPFNATFTKALPPRIHLLANPSTISINGLTVGIASPDILLHMGAEEISRNTEKVTADRLSRLTEHLLRQKSYYPLCPPAPGINISYEHMEQYGSLGPSAPHVLILPSDLRYFIKDVNSVCCINPGRLTKGQTGGTYCRFALPAAPAGVERVQDCVCAQIVKI